MDKKLRLGLLGCGMLGEIVAKAVTKGLLPEYQLVGLLSRQREESEAISRVHGGVVCGSVAELVALKPDYIVEAASPSALRELAPAALAAGIHVAALSMGAFADAAFYQQCASLGRAHGARVYIASGVIGGFDVMRTAALMGEVQASFHSDKGPESLQGTPVFDPQMMQAQMVAFDGTAQQAIELLPTRVNVTVAASLATIGPEKMRVSIRSTPGFVGDEHRIEVKGEQLHAIVDVYTKTSEAAGWSVVALLQNIVSPIVF